MQNKRIVEKRRKEEVVGPTGHLIEMEARKRIKGKIDQNVAIQRPDEPRAPTFRSSRTVCSESKQPNQAKLQGQSIIDQVQRGKSIQEKRERTYVRPEYGFQGPRKRKKARRI